MLTALILVCSLATVSNLAECTRDNALDVVHVPAMFASPVTCLVHAQAYVADSSIGRNLPQNEGHLRARPDQQSRQSREPSGGLGALIRPPRRQDRSPLPSIGKIHTKGVVCF
jgi:hypothetical protein